jgi:hypothetical protein
MYDFLIKKFPKDTTIKVIIAKDEKDAEKQILGNFAPMLKNIVGYSAPAQPSPIPSDDEDQDYQSSPDENKEESIVETTKGKVPKSMPAPVDRSIKLKYAMWNLPPPLALLAEKDEQTVLKL